jgi:hypothetical protein
VHCADAAAAYHVAAAGSWRVGRCFATSATGKSRLPPRDRMFVAAADHFVFVSRGTHDQFPIKLPARTLEHPLRRDRQSPPATPPRT